MNILVLKPCCLGDVLLTTPLLATLRATYPDARVDYAVGDGGRGALLTNPDVDDVLPLFEGRGLRRLGAALLAAWRLRWRRYDLAFIPDSGGLSLLVAYLAGIPRRIGVGRFPGSLLLTDAVPELPGRHQVDLYLDLAEAAGLRRHLNRQLKYVPTQVSLERAVHMMSSQGFDALPFRVALCPGGSADDITGYHRRWPGQRFSLLANELVARYGGGVVLLGDEDDRELNFRIRNDIDHPVLDLTGRLDTDSLGAMMQLCDAVIATDSDALQLAAAVGTPTVGIFGPTSARTVGPYGPKHRSVQGHIYCGPCARRGGPMEGCGAACMQRVTVRDMVAVLQLRPR